MSDADTAGPPNPAAPNPAAPDPDAPDTDVPAIALAAAEIRLVRWVGRVNVVVGVVALVALGAVQLLMMAGGPSYGPGFATVVWWPGVLLLNAGTFINHDSTVRPRAWVRHLWLAVVAGAADLALSGLYLSAGAWVQTLPLWPVSVAAVLDGYAAFRLRRVYPQLVAAELERATPAGALPWARAAAPLAQTCAMLSLTGILWIGGGMVWAGLSLVGKTGTIHLGPLLHVAAVAGALGGGLVQFLGGLVAMHGLNARTRGVRRGLVLAAVGGPIAGIWLYTVATVAAPAGLPWTGAAAMIVPPLIVPAMCGLTLVFFHRVFTTRAELTDLLAEITATGRAGRPVAELQARARALRILLGEG